MLSFLQKIFFIQNYYALKMGIGINSWKFAAVITGIIAIWSLRALFQIILLVNGSITNNPLGIFTSALIGSVAGFLYFMSGEKYFYIISKNQYIEERDLKNIQTQVTIFIVVITLLNFYI